jgi:hypothetical protein
MTAEYGRNLRKLLSLKRIERFVDFDSLPVFEDAITYPAIIIFSNNSPAPFIYHKLTKLNPALLDNLPSALEGDEKSILKVPINPEKIDEEIWNFAAKDELDIIDKIKGLNNSVLLGSFANPSTGVTTGSDKILLLNQKSIAKNRLEKGVLIKVLRGRNIEPWFVKGPFDYAIYPYKLHEGETQLISEKELKQDYPNAYDYLVKNKGNLLSRRDSRKEVAESKEWYSLIRKGKLEIFRSPKIVTPALTKCNSFALDEEGSAFLTGGAGVFAITQSEVDSRYLLAILNSELIEFFLHAISTKKQGGYFSYLHTFLAQIPIVKLSKEKQQPFIERVMKIFLKTSEINAKIERFHSRMLERFPNIRISKNLVKFNELTFSALLQEIQKVSGLKVPLNEVDEWEDYFDAYKDEINKLISEADEICKQLDLMIFNLYELTQEEQNVVKKRVDSERRYIPSLN